MADHCMPLLIINMGGEMLYILEQRLQAQSIVEEKSLRVLIDVINTMFSDKFITELFKPQKLYSSYSTRQIFDRLAHSSIMRLNQTSMDKLYDLMCMGTKYQILTINNPIDLLSISLNHLDSLRKLINNTNNNNNNNSAGSTTSPSSASNNSPATSSNSTITETNKLVELASNELISLFRNLKYCELFSLRYTLARFFQDRRVKVSLFLQDNIQQNDGNIIITNKGKVPKGTEIPGTIRYFNSENKVIKEEIVKLANAEGVINNSQNSTNSNNNSTNANITDMNNNYINAVNELLKTPRSCELGTNLYAKDRRKSKNANKDSNKDGKSSNPASTSPTNNTNNNNNKSGNRASAEFNELSDDNSKRAAKAELNLLAQIIGHSATAVDNNNNKNNTNNKDKFQIVNLFPDTSLSNTSESKDNNSIHDASDFITFDVEDANTRQQNIAKSIGNLSLDDDNNKNNDDNKNNDGSDLLDLMDSI